MLINLNQSKDFDRVDHQCLALLLQTAGFKPTFAGESASCITSQCCRTCERGAVQRSCAVAVSSSGMSSVSPTLRSGHSVAGYKRKLVQSGSTCNRSLCWCSSQGSPSTHMTYPCSCRAAVTLKLYRRHLNGTRKNTVAYIPPCS